MRIYTHVYVDLDAAFTTALYRDFVAPGQVDEIVFVPANWSGPVPPDAVALDLNVGIKGRQGEDGRVYSAFATVLEMCRPEIRQLFADVAVYVDAQDSGGQPLGALLRNAGVYLPAATASALFSVHSVSLQGVLVALRAAGKTDLDLVEFASTYLRGLHAILSARLTAREEAARCATLHDGGRVAVVRNSANRTLNSHLFESGVEVIVYVDGHNMGLIRKDGCPVRMDHPLIAAVVETAGELDEWYAHPAGFLFCRGSRKAPAETPSRVSPDDLAGAVAQALRA